MRSIRIVFPDRMPDSPMPGYRQGYIQAHNDGDAPIRFRFDLGHDRFNEIVVPPGERAVISGSLIYRARIEPLAYPRKRKGGLMRFGR